MVERLALVEHIVDHVLDWLVKHVGQSRNDTQTQSHRSIGSQGLIGVVFQSQTRVLDCGVDGEGRQTHGGNGLENSSLETHQTPVLGSFGDLLSLLFSEMGRLGPGFLPGHVQTQLDLSGLPTLVGNVSDQVSPGDAVSHGHEFGMGYRSE